MSKMYLGGELEYGKPIMVIFRMEGDGVLGDGQGFFEPGETYDGKTYDQIFDELNQKGHVEFADVIDKNSLDKAA